MDAFKEATHNHLTTEEKLTDDEAAEVVDDIDHMAQDMDTMDDELDALDGAFMDHVQEQQALQKNKEALKAQTGKTKKDPKGKAEDIAFDDGISRAQVEAFMDTHQQALLNHLEAKQQVLEHHQEILRRKTDTTYVSKQVQDALVQVISDKVAFIKEQLTLLRDDKPRFQKEWAERFDNWTKAYEAMTADQKPQPMSQAVFEQTAKPVLEAGINLGANATAYLNNTKSAYEAVDDVLSLGGLMALATRGKVKVPQKATSTLGTVLEKVSKKPKKGLVERATEATLKRYPHLIDILKDPAIKKKNLYEKHHIISNKNKATKNHPLWKLAGVDADTYSLNQILLPTNLGATVGTNLRSIHNSRHKDSISKNLATAMRDIVEGAKGQNWTTQQYKDSLDQLLHGQRKLLKAGRIKLNENCRAWADQ